jgi:uncharacterized protein YjbI with pentapeptide repeats
MANATADVLIRYAGGDRSFQALDAEGPDALALDGAVLEGADFSRSFLIGSFRRANLRGASFRDANVKCSDFSGADLTNADFRGAALCSTTFKGAILNGALFAGAYFHSFEMADGDAPNW